MTPSHQLPVGWTLTETTFKSGNVSFRLVSPVYEFWTLNGKPISGESFGQTFSKVARSHPDFAPASEADILEVRAKLIRRAHWFETERLPKLRAAGPVEMAVPFAQI